MLCVTRLFRPLLIPRRHYRAQSLQQQDPRCDSPTDLCSHGDNGPRNQQRTGDAREKRQRYAGIAENEERLQLRVSLRSGCPTRCADQTSAYKGFSQGIQLQPARDLHRDQPNTFWLAMLGDMAKNQREGTWCSIIRDACVATATGGGVKTQLRVSSIRILHCMYRCTTAWSDRSRE